MIVEDEGINVRHSVELLRELRHWIVFAKLRLRTTTRCDPFSFFDKVVRGLILLDTGQRLTLVWLVVKECFVEIDLDPAAPHDAG